MTDLGGSLAVASRGLFQTGVSTDLSGEMMRSAQLDEAPMLIAHSHVHGVWWQGWRHDQG